jgi:BirA family transcriptional regulator, biotin operon repressor / biotin---[acetyl-CoA-carboxylase] ligase
VALINNTPGKRFIKLLSVDSTNNYAMQQVQNKAANHGHAFFAFEQTAGRGQFNKQWLSAKGENIIMSVVIGTNGLLLQQQFLLNMIAALSTLQLFNKYTTEKVQIKWPNDIYCRDRKAAGILIENVIRGKTWQYAVAGFGVNINQTLFNENLQHAVSLKQITASHYDVVALAEELCNLLFQNIEMLFSGDMNGILEKYNQHLYRRNEQTSFKYGDEAFSGVVEWADENGNLIINSGTKKAYHSGQLQWLL